MRTDWERPLYVTKKLIPAENKRQETIEEFLARGGVIQKIVTAAHSNLESSNVGWGHCGTGQIRRRKTDSDRDFGKEKP